MNEKDLIHRLRAGEEKAFEYIFKTHFTGLCLFAEHFLKDTFAAEDLVEDLFLNLWANCHDLYITRSLKGYLYRSIYNNCLKYIRHKKIEQKYIDTQQYSFTDKELLSPNSRAYPIANLIIKELEEKISNAINKLPAQCKEIFCLNRYENLTYTEIASKMGLSVNTIKTQMTRALQKLRNEFKDYLIILAVIFSGF